MMIDAREDRTKKFSSFIGNITIIIISIICIICINLQLVFNIDVITIHKINGFIIGGLFAICIISISQIKNSWNK